LLRRRTVPAKSSEPVVIGTAQQRLGGAKALPEQRSQHVGIHRQQLDVAVARRTAVDDQRNVSDGAEEDVRFVETREQPRIDRPRCHGGNAADSPETGGRQRGSCGRDVPHFDGRRMLPAMQADRSPRRRGSGEVRIGTSGWSYANWRGVFFPAGLPHRRDLEYLASRFPTVAVNGTFYSLTRPPPCNAGRAAVPAGFVFAIKASRYITHMLRLRNVRPALANFLASGILRLGAQLGPLLWRLPPSLAFEEARADAFLAMLPRTMADAERCARRHDARTTCRASLGAPDAPDRALRTAP